MICRAGFDLHGAQSSIALIAVPGQLPRTAPVSLPLSKPAEEMASGRPLRRVSSRAPAGSSMTSVSLPLLFRLGHLLPHDAVPVRAPDALLALELFPLPDLDLGLALLEGLLAGAPRRLTVRTGQGNEDALLAHGHGAETVYQGDSLQGVLRHHVLCDGHHGP